MSNETAHKEHSFQILQKVVVNSMICFIELNYFKETLAVCYDSALGHLLNLKYFQNLSVFPRFQAFKRSFQTKLKLSQFRDYFTQHEVIYKKP